MSRTAREPAKEPRRRSPRTRPAGDRAYDWIVEAILTGEFAEGEFVEEVALAEQVGTSRTPVREALQRLQAERYVDLVPRRGAQVRMVNAREMGEIYQARFVVESHVVANICERRRGAPPELGAVADEMDLAAAELRWHDSARLDQEFHQQLVRWNGNDVLTQMYESLRSRQIRLALRTITTAPQRYETISREHRELISALEDHDGERASRLIAVHLREVPELVQAFGS
ncbi:GntR family transcriptional regulator [Georgenia sp. Z1491]|uniref:GntR family transcriptional regulator n=1 Tax=Georgenia sp. Z1491 TaxID=3416707 RepID=UPI003CF90238